MKRRLIEIAAVMAALSAAHSSYAQTQPTRIEASARKSWTHKPTKIGLPPTIGTFARGDVMDLSGGPLLDVSVAYDDAVSRTHVNVYLYHAAVPSTALWFDVAATMIATNSKFGEPQHQGDPIVFTLPGSPIASGLRQSFTITKIGRSSGVALVAIGEWVVKLRMTSPNLDPAQLDTAIAQFMDALDWPRKLPPLIAASPLTRCPQPIAFGPRATKMKADGAAVLLGAMRGSLATEARSKAKVLKHPALCIHGDRIGGRLPVYQKEGGEGGYLIPLGDSGELLEIGKDWLAGILLGEAAQDDGATPWSVTVMKLDKWVQYPSYDAMPPPTQAVEIVQSENPLSTTSVYGKGNMISLSPDAMKGE